MTLCTVDVSNNANRYILSLSIEQLVSPFLSIFTFMPQLNTSAAVYTVYTFHDEWTIRNGPKVLGKMSGSIDFHSK